MGELRHRIKAVSDLFKTRIEAARTAGVSVDQLAKYIDGSTAKVPLDPLIRLSRAKRVRLEWLATGDGPQFEAFVAEGRAPYTSLPDDFEGRMTRLGAASKMIAAVDKDVRDAVGEAILMSIRDLVFLGALKPEAAPTLLAAIADELRLRAAKDGKP